jgi:hypothetical protein
MHIYYHYYSKRNTTKTGLKPREGQWCNSAKTTLYLPKNEKQFALKNITTHLTKCYIPLSAIHFPIVKMLKTRKRREADVTELPVHRGRLKIIEGIEWHEELLDVNSEAFLLLENELLTMVCNILLNVW